MRVCIVGAGAIGGYVGARLGRAGEEVTLIARGAHLGAIKKSGVRLLLQDDMDVVKWVRATNSFRDAGKQDIVILAVKAHQIAPIAADLRALFDPHTMVVTMQNGVPWWYFQKYAGEFEGYRIKAVDPDGVISANIEAERIIGCIAYPAAEVSGPGIIRHVEGDRFPIGELDGLESDRVRLVSDMFTRAGFKSPILSDIRSEIWLKLWGNLTFNPVSALTHSTLVDICQFPLTRALASQMMSEAQAIAEKLGAHFRVPLEKRIAGAEKVGKHKTSMLQDVESGKGLETDALLGAVIELGELTGTPTPSLSSVYACVKLLDRTIVQEGLYVKAQPHGSAAPAADLRVRHTVTA